MESHGVPIESLLSPYRPYGVPIESRCFVPTILYYYYVTDENIQALRPKGANTDRVKLVTV